MNTTVLGAVAVLIVLAIASAWALRMRSQAGRLRQPRSVLEITSDDVGRPLGERATLLQFSSAYCQPCQASRIVLRDVAAAAPGVAHVDLDVRSNMGLVRRLGVTRTPTVFILDAAGVAQQEASDVPRKADVVSALGRISGGAHPSGARGEAGPGIDHASWAS